MMYKIQCKHSNQNNQIFQGTMLIPIHFPELEIAESNHMHCDRDQTHT